MDLESSQPPQQGAKKRNPMEDLKREIMIMKKMKHTNIVTLSEVIDDPAGSKLLLVMEYMEGGPVLTREALEKRERLPESLALQYFRDMIKVGWGGQERAEGEGGREGEGPGGEGRVIGEGGEGRRGRRGGEEGEGSGVEGKGGKGRKGRRGRRGEGRAWGMGGG